jgi:hypothetical protein
MKGKQMKKFLMTLLLGAMVFSFTGCKEKSASEKLGDSLKKSEKQLEKDAKKAKKEVDKALK